MTGFEHNSRGKNTESAGPNSEAVSVFDAIAEAEHLASGARGATVARTHRVVREQATSIRDRRRTVRSLVIPLLICSAVLFILWYAITYMVCQRSLLAMEGNLTSGIAEVGRFFTSQVVDSGGPVYVLLLWFLPVSVIAGIAILLRRNRSGEARR